MSVGVFHHNDLDGYAAAAVVAADYDKEFGSNTNIWFMECDYKDKFIEAKRFETECRYAPDEVYIVDLSFITVNEFEEVYDILETTGVSRVTWIDHHTASARMLPLLKKDKRFKKYSENGRLNMRISEQRSGAWLTYTHLFRYRDRKFKHPPVIRLVDDYDRWVHSTIDSTYLNNAFYSCHKGEGLKDPNSMEWRRLIGGYATTEHRKQYHPYIYCGRYIDQSNALLLSYLHDGQIIAEYKSASYEAYYNQFAYEKTFEGHKAIVVNQKTNSEIFGTHYHDYPLHIVWVFDGKQYVYSIYTDYEKTGIDCNAIANKYGGGGHLGAAGFTSKKKLV